MNWPITMSVTVVQLNSDDRCDVVVSTGNITSGDAITQRFQLPYLDAPEDYRDFAQQAMAAICEML